MPKLLNSVALANKAYKELRGHSILPPTEGRLMEIVEGEAPEETPRFVITNAYGRVKKRLDDWRAAKQAYDNHIEAFGYPPDGHKQGSPGARLLDRVHDLDAKPITDGPY